MKIVGVIIVLAVIVSLAFLSRYGLFASVTITEKNVGPFLLVYKKHIGDYKDVGQIMDKIYYDLKDSNSIETTIETTKGFGLYYDNPQEVDKKKLRSIVGCIVENKSMDDLEKIKSKYGVKEYPSSKSVVAEFPYKGKPSIFLGILKVYPKLGAYISEHNYAKTPIMELYDQPNEKIEYIASVSLQKKYSMIF